MAPRGEIGGAPPRRQDWERTRLARTGPKSFDASSIHLERASTDRGTEGVHARKITTSPQVASTFEFDLAPPLRNPDGRRLVFQTSHSLLSATTRRSTPRKRGQTWIFCADVIYCAKCHFLRFLDSSAVGQIPSVIYCAKCHFLRRVSFSAPNVTYCAECHLLRRVSIIAPMSFIAPSVIYCAKRLVPRCHLLHRVSIIAPMSFIAPSVIYCAERLVPRCHLLRRVSIIALMSFIAPSVIYCAEHLVPRYHFLRRVSFFAPDVIYCAVMCHFLRRSHFLCPPKNEPNLSRR